MSIAINLKKFMAKLCVLAQCRDRQAAKGNTKNPEELTCLRVFYLRIMENNKIIHKKEVKTVSKIVLLCPVVIISLLMSISAYAGKKAATVKISCRIPQIVKMSKNHIKNTSKDTIVQYDRAIRNNHQVIIKSIVSR